MSQEAELVFAMERRRRAELFRSRVRNKTQEFYMRYRQQYENMLREGYQDYIPEELERLSHDLDTVSSLLGSDPAAARQVSQEIGQYIRSLWGLGKEARQVFQETARIRREQAKQEKAAAKNAILSHYYDTVGSLDSVVANFAAESLTEIKQSISDGKINSTLEMDARLAPILTEAKTKATDWKNQKQKERENRVLIEQIEEQQESVKNEKFEDNTKSAALLAKLDAIKQRVTAGNVDTKGIQESIKAVSQETDEALVDEEVRREMVKAIYKWFGSHDFSLSKPKLIDGTVVLTAKKPSGNKAQFKLTSDNKMFYRLDGYEGQSCLKDIASAKADWESVYGIRTSDEKIKWQNPDRILRWQNSTETDVGGHM